MAEDVLPTACKGLEVAATEIAKLPISSARNSATKMLRHLGGAEALDRHFTEKGTGQWLGKLRQFLATATASGANSCGDTVAVGQLQPTWQSGSGAASSGGTSAAVLREMAAAKSELERLQLVGKAEETSRLRTEVAALKAELGLDLPA